MKVESKHLGDVTVLTGIGELDAFHLPRLSDRIDEHIAEGRQKLVLNLHLLESIDSSSFGYLVKTKQALADSGGNLVLVQPSKFVLKSLTLLGLRDFFVIAESEEEGALTFGGD